MTNQWLFLLLSLLLNDIAYVKVKTHVVVSSFTTKQSNSLRVSTKKHGIEKNTCSSRLYSSWEDKVKGFFFAGENSQKKQQSIDDIVNTTGSVIRLAAKQYDPVKSMTSSREYTTRKVEFDSVRVDKEGVKGDYNHYRTTALKSTENRAVSILTQDIMNSIRTTYKKNYAPKVQQGDLGENILVDGVPFNYFRVGQQYQFVSEEAKEGGGRGGGNRVIVEITEPMEPCAHLCTLPYINDVAIAPNERIARCQNFIQYLGQADGFRGWYAKVLQEGDIDAGATVSVVQQ